LLSLISFELTAHLLKDTLPVAETVNAASVRNHLHRVAERAEAALGDERGSFIEGCPREWAALPPPAPPLTESECLHKSPSRCPSAPLMELVGPLVTVV
jgi:hypothetical protein